MLDQKSLSCPSDGVAAALLRAVARRGPSDTASNAARNNFDQGDEPLAVPVGGLSSFQRPALDQVGCGLVVTIKPETD